MQTYVSGVQAARLFKVFETPSFLPIRFAIGKAIHSNVSAEN